MLFVGALLSGIGLPVAGDGPAAGARITNIAGVNLELSALAVVPEGVLVADDELVGSVLFVEHGALESAGTAHRASLIKINRARKDSEPNSDLPRLFAVHDFEGMAASAEKSAVYLIGSHAPTEQERHRRTDREFLIKARWRPEELDLRVRPSKEEGVPGIYRKLIDHLASQVDISGPGGFNVEGLALRDGSLYIGLRAPLSNGETGKALVFSIKERDLFGKKSRRFSGPFKRLELDLGGAGVRGLHWDQATNRLLVLSGPSAHEGGAPQAVWSYDFSDEALILGHQFTPEQIAEHGNPEGITRFDAGRLLIAFDTDEATRASLMLLPWK